jgi:hypothetical protein
MSIKDSKRVGAQDTSYAVMSALYTQSSLPDSNLASGKEQGSSSLGVVLSSKIKTLEIHRN